MEQALVVENLKKSYGKFEALHGCAGRASCGLGAHWKFVTHRRIHRRT
jgi:hypothetical protein